MLLLVYKAFGVLGPSYLSGKLLTYEPSRTLRSSGSRLLIIPEVETTHGEAAFYYYGPSVDI